MTSQGRRPVVVVAEHWQGRLIPITYELIACARKIREMAGCEIIVAVLGEQFDELANDIAAQCGERVVAVQGPGLALYNAEMYKDALEQIANEVTAAYVCAAHTAQGLDFAPGLAIRLNAACITGVERISIEQNRLRFSRPACDGKLQLEVEPKTETTVFTVPTGVYAPAFVGQGERRAVETRAFAATPVRTRTLGLTRTRETSAALASAKVIVAAGRGIGASDALGEIQRLAAVIPHSAVAGSRPICDLGWLPYANQVGLTGATVAPDLYIACGISGSRQHTVGMTGSKFIVAINLDPQAAIFQLADIGIVEDVHRFIPALTATITKRGE
jgi:electron transfer flavoprotein alpha subunit